MQGLKFHGVSDLQPGYSVIRRGFHVAVHGLQGSILFSQDL